MPEELLPKPQTDLPLPQTDLPLPEKEIPAHIESSEPLPVVDGEVKGNKLKFLLIVLLAILILGGIALGAYAMGKKSSTPTPTPIVNDPSPTPIEVLNTYSGDGFVFVVPDGYEIQRQTADETVWKSAFTPGQFNYASMILSSQALPFNKDQITIYPRGEDSDVKINETITRENESTFEVGSRMVTRYDASCGPDCLYHVLEFENEGTNYRLLFNGAGGGLSAKFDTILESLNFSDTSNLTNDKGI